MSWCFQYCIAVQNILQAVALLVDQGFQLNALKAVPQVSLGSSLLLSVKQKATRKCAKDVVSKLVKKNCNLSFNFFWSVKLTMKL